MGSARVFKTLRMLKKPKISLSSLQRSTKQANVFLPAKRSNKSVPLKVISKEQNSLSRLNLNSKHSYNYSNATQFPFLTTASIIGAAAWTQNEKSKRTVTRGPDTEIIDEHPNLLEYPTEREFPFDKECQITIGDLHGNALKLIYFLVRQNVLDLCREDYNEIVRIYQKKTEDLTREDIDKFNAILEHAQFHEIPKNAMIRLIGDELADRGSNDYFVLKVFEKMKKSSVPFEILFSNHGYEFLKVYEQGLMDNKSYLEKFEGGFAQSLTNLRRLIEKKIISLSDVDQLVKQYYLPQLRLISYSLQTVPSYYWSLLKGLTSEYGMDDVITPEESVTIYSHAPIGIETIKSLTSRDGIQVPYSDQTATEFAKMIEQINMKFTHAATNHQVFATFGAEIQQKVKVDDIPLSMPVQRSIWSRGHQNKDVPLNKLNQFSLYYVHGHDGNGKVNEKYQDHVTNLDNSFGKGEGEKNDQSKYSVLRTHATCLR